MREELQHAPNAGVVAMSADRTDAASRIGASAPEPAQQYPPGRSRGVARRGDTASVQSVTVGGAHQRVGSSQAFIDVEAAANYHLMAVRIPIGPSLVGIRRAEIVLHVSVSAKGSLTSPMAAARRISRSVRQDTGQTYGVEIASGCGIEGGDKTSEG